MFKASSPELKVLIVNIAIALAITVFTVIGDSGYDDLIFYFGVAALIIGLIDIPVAIVLCIANSPLYGKAFLISAGLMLLSSGISCGSGVIFG